jgi:hypothetical protein
MVWGTITWRFLKKNRYYSYPFQKGIEPSICVNPSDFVFYEWQIPAHILSYASLPPLLHFTGCRPWGCGQGAGYMNQSSVIMFSQSDKNSHAGINRILTESISRSSNRSLVTITALFMLYFFENLIICLVSYFVICD